MLSGGIRQNDAPMMENSRLITSSRGNRELHGYDGPLSYSVDDPDRLSPNVSYAPTVVTVKSASPCMTER